MSRKIPDKLLANAADLIRAGARLKEAAEAVGFTADQVSTALRGRGFKIPIGHRPGRPWGRPPTKLDSISAETKAQVVTMYLSGDGSPNIGRKLGISRSNVERILEERAIPRRSVGDANRLMASNRTIEQRRQYTESARSRRMQNAIENVQNGIFNPSIGFGEAELATLLESKGIVFEQQTVIDSYLIDITIGNVAIEVKTSSTSAHISKNNEARFKKIGEAGYKFVFLVCNNARILTEHANYLVSYLNRISRLPTISGQYWVIRCRLEQIGSHHEVDHWSVEKRTPKPLDRDTTPELDLS